MEGNQEYDADQKKALFFSYAFLTITLGYFFFPEIKSLYRHLSFQRKAKSNTDLPENQKPPVISDEELRLERIDLREQADFTTHQKKFKESLGPLKKYTRGETKPRRTKALSTQNLSDSEVEIDHAYFRGYRQEVKPEKQATPKKEPQERSFSFFGFLWGNSAQPTTPERTKKKL